MVGGSKDWKSFVKTAEALCKRTLGRNEDNKKKGFSLIGGEKIQNKEEEERKKNKMKERGEAEDLGSRLGQSHENSDFGRPKSDGELDEWEMDDQQSKVQDAGAKRRRTCWTRLTSGRWEITWTCFSAFTEIAIRNLIISHTWQEKKGRLGTSTSPKQELGLSFFDGGVSIACDDKIKNKVG